MTIHTTILSTILLSAMLFASCTKHPQTNPVCFEGADFVLMAIEEWKDTPVLDDTEGNDAYRLAYLDVQIDTLDIQPQYITLHRYVEGYYEGAAHGFHLEEGATFTTSRVEPLDWEDFWGDMPMDSVLRLTNDLLRAQNPDVFFLDDGLQPLPHSRPYIVGDTLILIYQEYEIAPYACGIIKVKMKRI